MPTLSEAAIRAGSAFYETAAAAREASSRADGLAASAAAAAGAARRGEGLRRGDRDGARRRDRGGRGSRRGRRQGGRRQRRGSAGAGDADLVEAIRQTIAGSPFHGEGYRKIWARLRHGGLRTLEAAGAAADAGERLGGGDPVRFSPRTEQL